MPEGDFDLFKVDVKELVVIRIGDPPTTSSSRRGAKAAAGCVRVERR